MRQNRSTVDILRTRRPHVGEIRYVKLVPEAIPRRAKIVPGALGNAADDGTAPTEENRSGAILMIVGLIGVSALLLTGHVRKL